MTRSLVVRIASALALAACGNDGSNLPINPGGGGGGTGSSNMGPDAAVEDDASTSIAGRVCLISDARTPVSCAAGGAGNLTVTLGAETATTIDNGAFVILRPTGTNLVWGVSGSGIEPSAMAFSPSATTVPAIGTLLYGEMLTATNATVVGGNGAIIARMANGSAGVAGLAAIATPQPDSEVYYDGATELAWEQDATGAAGVVWIPSISTGTASLVLDSGAAQKTVSSIGVFADTITFVLTTFP